LNIASLIWKLLIRCQAFYRNTYIQALAVAVPALLYCQDNVTLLKFLWLFKVLFLLTSRHISSMRLNITAKFRTSLCSYLIIN